MNKEDWKKLAIFCLTFIVGTGGTVIIYERTVNRELGEHKTKIEQLEKLTEELKQSQNKLEEKFNQLNVAVNGLDIKFGYIKPGEGKTIKKVTPTSPTTTVNLNGLGKK